MRRNDAEDYLKALKFGRGRAGLVLHHQETRRSFYWHQAELAAVASLNITLFAASSVMALGSGRALFASLALLCLTCGRREAQRMRACGRYHQCKRSLETVGI